MAQCDVSRFRIYRETAKAGGVDREQWGTGTCFVTFLILSVSHTYLTLIMPVIRNPFNEVTLELQSVIDAAEEALLMTGGAWGAVAAAARVAATPGKTGARGGAVAAATALAVATTSGGGVQLGGAVNASSVQRVMRRRLRLLSTQRFGRERGGDIQL